MRARKPKFSMKKIDDVKLCLASRSRFVINFMNGQQVNFYDFNKHKKVGRKLFFPIIFEEILGQ